MVLRPGYIAVSRKLLASDLWLGEPFTRAQAWIDLIGLARWHPGTVHLRGVQFDLKRGQLAWSHVSLAKRWGWGRRKVARFLDRLESDHRIVQQKNNVTSITTILNYDVYQSSGTAKGTASGTASGTRTKKDNQENPPQTPPMILSKTNGGRWWWKSKDLELRTPSAAFPRVGNAASPWKRSGTSSDSTAMNPDGGVPGLCIHESQESLPIGRNPTPPLNSTRNVNVLMRNWLCSEQRPKSVGRP